MVSGLALAALAISGVAASAEPVPPGSSSDRCAVEINNGWNWWYVDCQESRYVRVRVLLAESPEPGDCDNGCDQAFLVHCEDYWSVEHLTDYAIVHYEAPTWEQTIPLSALPESHEATSVLLHRELDCIDEDPAEGGAWGGFWRDRAEATEMLHHSDRGARLSAADCLAQEDQYRDPECTTYCCFQYSYFFDVVDELPVPIESLRTYGELPCFRLLGSSVAFAREPIGVHR